MSLLSRGSLLRLFLLSLPPTPLISSRVFSTRVFIAFFSGRDNHPWIGFAFEIQIPAVSKRRFDETGKDKLELLYRGRGEKARLLISVPFKAEGGKNAARRVSKSLASRSSFSSSCVPGKLSLSFSLSISLFFSSLLETHRKLSSPPFPSRASRFIRFSSAKISILFGRGIDTFSSSSPDIPEQPAPLPYVSLSRTRIYETTRSRE